MQVYTSDSAARRNAGIGFVENYNVIILSHS